jgi:lipase
MHTHRSTTVPVRGGDLTVGVWEPTTQPTRTVVAIHGISSNHLAWTLLTRHLEGTLVIAPDLRGRGRSNHLPQPWDLEDHADDVSAVTEALGVSDARVIGHAMGAFVAVTLAHRHPHAVSALVLADGGLPMADAPATLPAAYRDRLLRVYSDPAEYRGTWRAIPSMADAWSPEIEAFVDYDLVPVDDGYRTAARAEAVATSMSQLRGGPAYEAALSSLALPITFLWPTRGFSGMPALYDDGSVARLSGLVHDLRIEPTHECDHYTIVFSQRGAALCAKTLS